MPPVPPRLDGHRVGLRLAFVLGDEFPCARHAHLYEQIDAIAAALGAEARVFHTRPADPTTLTPALRARLGSDFCVPQHVLLHANDVRWWRACEPRRCDDVLGDLARIAHWPRDEVESWYELGIGFTLARWLAAWGAHYVHSLDTVEASVPALVAAHLLQLPRGLSIAGVDAPGAHQELLAINVWQASVVALRDDAEVARFRARFSGDQAEGAVIAPAPAGAEALAARIRAVIDARRDVVRMTPRAAFAGPGALTPASLPLLPFVVTGAERTGTQLLTDQLNSHPACRAHGELFNSRQIDEARFAFPDEGLGESPHWLALRRSDPGALVDELLRRDAAAGRLAAGFKLLYYHAAFDDRVLDHALARRETRFVHLRRRNVLQRCLSLRRAERDDLWYLSSAGGRSPSSDPIELDPRETLREFLLTEVMTARFASLLEGRRVLELEYDDFTRDLPQTAACLADHLGLPRWPLEAKAQKTGTAPPERAIANWDALARAFSGTRWAEFFAPSA